ncbi:MAG TPA: DUF4432 family protein [Chloroflexota bacterium]|nr:DUF4432 family protein [Chloroflexota bacterium]
MPSLFGRHYSRAELLRRVGHLSQVGGVQLLAFEDGPSRGVRVLEFRTGTGFVFKVAVDRGMDVGYCEYRGASLAWIPPTVLPGPWYFEQQTEFGWLRTALGGFCNSSGMIHIGNPETASVEQYNFAPRSTERYGVHDRMALLPGQLMSYGERWEGDDCILEATGRTIQAQAYGENLVLTRRYTARLGESRFWVHDVVENAGYLPTEHMLLYHMNIGFPFVDEGAELVAPIGEAPGTFAGSVPDGLRGTYGKYIAPQKDWIYEGYEHDMIADAEGNVRVAIVNPRANDGLGVYVIYRRQQLPRYIEWRMMGEGQYVVGIEPCTNLFGRDAVREAGDLIVLQPGEKRAYGLEVGVLSGHEEIERFRTRVVDARTAR